MTAIKTKADQVRMYRVASPRITLVVAEGRRLDELSRAIAQDVAGEATIEGVLGHIPGGSQRGEPVVPGIPLNVLEQFERVLALPGNETRSVQRLG